MQHRSSILRRTDTTGGFPSCGWSSRFTQTPKSAPSMASEWISSASVTSVTGSDVISFPEVLLLVLPGKLFSNWDHTSGRTEELGNLSTRVCGLRSQLLSQNGLRGLYSGTDTFLTHREVAVLQLNPGPGQGHPELPFMKTYMRSVPSINLDRK